MGCLKQKDLREAYSITLPERAYAYYSLITISRPRNPFSKRSTPRPPKH
jgi:arginine utilization protein RocB